MEINNAKEWAMVDILREERQAEGTASAKVLRWKRNLRGSEQVRQRNQETQEMRLRRFLFVSQRHFINPSVMVNTGCQSDRLSPGDKSLGVSVKRFLDWAIEVGRPRKCGRQHSKFLACIKRRRELPAS